MADASDGGERALDAAAVTVAPGSLAASSTSGSSDLRITPDRGRYKPQDKLALRARLDGASGDALLGIDGARTYAVKVAAVWRSASATLPLADPQGDVRAFAAFVRDSAIVTDAIPSHSTARATSAKRN